LVAGGDCDPNLDALITCFKARGIACRALLVGAQTHPRLTWDVVQDTLNIDGEPWCPAALFLRHDVFTSLIERRPAPGQRAMAWFTTLSGWALGHPEVKLLNRESALQITNKPHVLFLAQRAGLEVPATLISNDHAFLSGEVRGRQLIVKPVNGGDYARELEPVLESAPVKGTSLAGPAIVQARLEPPEVRIYGIGDRFFVFRLEADALDYRTTADCRVVAGTTGDVPASLLAGLSTLMQHLRLDFGAADFKTCPQSGRLLFLEINDGPMFVAFDQACDGALTHAIADVLDPA